MSAKNSGLASITQLHEFDEIIDVRTPLEFAEDHLPNAINCPVLSNEERVRVGTLYKQSPFEAKKIGAILIARNIVQHLETHWMDKPKNWHPLIYCWRGGKRSGAMTHILRQVGFAAEQLDGGYKSYRQHVRQELDALPAQFSFRVLCGLTGSGKSRLLLALQASGAQVLDLETLAQHRGSVLGDLPDAAQPSQKKLDSLIWHTLNHFDRARPVYVESESKKIGLLRVPDSLMEAMWKSPCLRLDTPDALRIGLLCEDYAHFLHDPVLLAHKLNRLRGRYANELLDHWHAQCQAQDWGSFISELLAQHYDPAYLQSMRRNYPHYDQAASLIPCGLQSCDWMRLAEQCLALSGDFDNNAAHPQEA